MLDVGDTKERPKLTTLKLPRTLQDFAPAKTLAISCRNGPYERKTQAGKFHNRRSDVDAQLYGWIFGDGDKAKITKGRSLDENRLADLHLDFSDDRLEQLLLLAKTRQFPKNLSKPNRLHGKNTDTTIIRGRARKSVCKNTCKNSELSVLPTTTDSQRYILEELKPVCAKYCALRRLKAYTLDTGEGTVGRESFKSPKRNFCKSQ